VLTAGPSGTTADTSAVLAFAGDPDAASFECAVDGAAFAPCSSPAALSLLAHGSHTFAVRASDAAGNVDGTPASRTWSVDPSWGGPVTTTGQVTAGGTLSSIPAHPVAAAVTTPVAGAVSITTSSATDTPPGGYSLLGEQVQITAPQAAAGDPLVLAFRLDGSLLPAGVAPADVAVFRDGVLVADCTGAGAVPDPCIASRTMSGDDVVLVVRSSTASRWNLGRQKTPTTTTVPPTRTTSVPATQTTSAPPITASQEQPPGGTPTPSRRCVVPKLKALTLTAARNRLTEASCRLGTIRRQRHRGKAGIVLAQGKRAGRSLPANTRINLTISRH